MHTSPHSSDQGGEKRPYSPNRNFKKLVEFFLDNPHVKVSHTEMGSLCGVQRITIHRAIKTGKKLSPENRERLFKIEQRYKENFHWDAKKDSYVLTKLRTDPVSVLEDLNLLEVLSQFVATPSNEVYWQDTWLPSVVDYHNNRVEQLLMRFSGTIRILLLHPFGAALKLRAERITPGKLDQAQDYLLENIDFFLRINEKNPEANIELKLYDDIPGTHLLIDRKQAFYGKYLALGYSNDQFFHATPANGTLSANKLVEHFNKIWAEAHSANRNVLNELIEVLRTKREKRNKLNKAFQLFHQQYSLYIPQHDGRYDRAILKFENKVGDLRASLLFFPVGYSRYHKIACYGKLEMLEEHSLKIAFFHEENEIGSLSFSVSEKYGSRSSLNFFPAFWQDINENKNPRIRKVFGLFRPSERGANNPERDINRLPVLASEFFATVDQTDFHLNHQWKHGAVSEIGNQDMAWLPSRFQVIFKDRYPMGTKESGPRLLSRIALGEVRLNKSPRSKHYDVIFIAPGEPEIPGRADVIVRDREYFLSVQLERILRKLPTNLSFFIRLGPERKIRPGSLLAGTYSIIYSSKAIGCGLLYFQLPTKPSQLRAPVSVEATTDDWVMKNKVAHLSHIGQSSLMVNADLREPLKKFAGIYHVYSAGRRRSEKELNRRCIIRGNLRIFPSGHVTLETVSGPEKVMRAEGFAERKGLFLYINLAAPDDNYHPRGILTTDRSRQGEFVIRMGTIKDLNAESLFLGTFAGLSHHYDLPIAKRIALTFVGNSSQDIEVPKAQKFSFDSESIPQPISDLLRGPRKNFIGFGNPPVQNLSQLQRYNRDKDSDHDEQLYLYAAAHLMQKATTEKDIDRCYDFLRQAIYHGMSNPEIIDDFWPHQQILKEYWLKRKNNLKKLLS